MPHKDITKIKSINLNILSERKMGKLPVGILWDGMKGHQMVTQIYTKKRKAAK